MASRLEHLQWVYQWSWPLEIIESYLAGLKLFGDRVLLQMKGLIVRGWRSFNFVAVLPSQLSLESNTSNGVMLKGFQVSESVSVTIFIFQYHFPLWLLEAIRQSPRSVNVSVRAHLIWEYWEDRLLKPGSYPWCQIRWPCQKASWCWSYSAKIMSFTAEFDQVLSSFHWLLYHVPSHAEVEVVDLGVDPWTPWIFMNLLWSLCLSAICLWHWLLILWCQWQGPRWDCFFLPLDWIHSDLRADW